MYNNQRPRKNIRVETSGETDKKYVERDFADTRNQNKVLDILEIIEENDQETMYALQKACFEREISPELLDYIERYISLVVSLAKILRPKIIKKIENDKDNELKMQETEKLNQLLIDVDDYVAHLSDMDISDIDFILTAFKHFTTIEKTLRITCEDLEYTTDREKLQSM